MKTLIRRTKRDLRAGAQSWRVISVGSFFSVITTVGYLVALS